MFVARTLLATSLLLSSVCGGQDQPVRHLDSESASLPQRIAGNFEALEQATEVKLLKPIGNFHFDETPLEDILRQIQIDSDVQILLDRTARERGLQLEKAITFSAEGISVDKALELLLAEHDADFINDHGVVRVISRDVRSTPGFLMTRVYNCQRLLERLPELGEAIANADPDKEKSTALRQLAMEMVTPDEWNSGAISVRQIGNLLVVTHHRRGHRSLQELLARLETQVQPDFDSE